jgi:cleavage and polyadenylation specificity factor subunit 1
MYFGLQEVAEQNCCAEMQRLLGGTSLKSAFRQTGTQHLANDISTGVFHPIVPLKFRKNIFDHFNNVAHPGKLASRHIISFRFVWRGLSSDITAWTCGCLACQRGKIHRHIRLVPQPIPIPQQRFSHLHVELVGPLQYSNSFNYIFTIINRTSKWMEAIPLSETSAAACAKALTFTWISCSGVPEMITLDRRPQFTSNLWPQLCKMLNISHQQTTAYHSESNGAVERLHRCLKDVLHTCTAASTWSEELPFVLLGLRAQPREDNGLFPAEAVFGASIVLPYELLQTEEISVDSIIKTFPKTLDAPASSLPRHNSGVQLPSKLPAELFSAPLIWVHRGGVVPPLHPLYDSSYAVLRHGPRSFTI